MVCCWLRQFICRCRPETNKQTHVESVGVEALRVGEDVRVVVDGHHVQVHRRPLLDLVPCIIDEHSDSVMLQVRSGPVAIDQKATDRRC